MAGSRSDSAAPEASDRTGAWRRSRERRSWLQSCEIIHIIESSAMRIPSHVAGILIASIGVALQASAQKPAPATDTPEWVARQIEERDTGRDSRLELTMRLFDRHQRVRERSMVLSTMRGSGNRGDRVLIRFLDRK